MEFSDAIMDKDGNEDPDEVIFVTPHAQPIFVPDSDIDDASWLILFPCMFWTCLRASAWPSNQRMKRWHVLQR